MKLLVKDIVASHDRGEISCAQATNLLEALVANAAAEKPGVLDEWAMVIWRETPEEIDYGVAYRMAHQALEARDRVKAALKSVGAGH